MMANRTIILKALLVASIALVDSLFADDVVLPKEAIGFVPQRRVIGVNNFDNWVYGMDPASMRSRIDAQIAQRIRELSKKHRLTDDARKKLELAANVDRARIDAEIDALRRKFEETTAGDVVIVQIQGFANEASQLRNKQQNLYGPASFFAKTLKKILADEDPSVSRHRSNVENAIRIFSSQELQKSQREKLEALLFKESRPEGQVVQEFDDLLVKYRLSVLPENKLKPLFDETEWPFARQKLDDLQRLGPILALHGLIDPNRFRDEDPAMTQHAAHLVDASKPMTPERTLLLRRHRANLNATVRMVERHVNLEPAQQRALLELLFREISIPVASGNYDDLVVQYELSQLPEARLKPIFYDGQWRKVRRALDKVASFKPLLVEQGLISSDASPPVNATGPESLVDATRVNKPADATIPANQKGY
jgi:hypothetical protein